MSDDLLAFLNARLDEDVLFARCTNGGEWTFDDRGQLLVNQGVTISKIANLGVSTFGQHIARHDPARTLREVEAKRAILARYVAARAWSYPPGDGDEAVQDELGETVRRLAAIWNDHPDYRPEWKP